MEALVQDVKKSARVFRDAPAFAAAVVLTVTLGIAVNTAVFSVVDRVLIAPLPISEPDRLVLVMNGTETAPISRATPNHFAHWRQQTDVLEGVAAWRGERLNYMASDGPIAVEVAAVSADYFRVLRAPIVAGRGFSAEDDRPGAEGTAVVSHAFWSRQLGSDPNAVGRTLNVGGRAYTVIGIAGADVDVRDLGRQPQLWLPLQVDPSRPDDSMSLEVLARLRDGVTLEHARARIVASVSEYRERFPGAFDVESDEAGFTVLSVHEAIVGDARSMLLVLFASVGLVMLIACANVANLMLARGTRRHHDVAIHSALGAGRGRLVRQLLTESLLLALVGGALGLVAGYIGVRALLSIDTADLPRLGDAASLLALDWRIAGFAVGLAVVTALIFGLPPALETSRADLYVVLDRSGGRSGGGFRHGRARALLVATQMGLAVVLLIGAGLLIRTVSALGTVELGFSTEELLTMSTWLPDSRFTETASVTQATGRALEALRSLPGVESAAVSCCVPTRNVIDLPFAIAGGDEDAPFTGIASTVPVSPGYFETLGIPLRSGRAFDARDDASAPPVIMINQAMADRYWADGGSPLRERIRIGASIVPQLADEPPREIIGVVGNVRELGIHRDAGPAVYFPQAQTSDTANTALVRNAPMAWLVRTSVPSGTVAAAASEALSRALGVPVTDVEAMDGLFSAITSRHRLNMWLMSVFGGCALLLAAIGIHGVIAYSVEQRRYELGVRMALGAERSAIRRMVIRRGLLPVLTGGAAGLAAAYALANVLASTLYGVAPHDPAVFVAVPVLLAAVAGAAVCVPAARASGLDPALALRRV